MAELEIYRHSGKLGLGMTVVPVTAVIAALLLGTAYSYANVYSPVAGYVSIVLVFIFAFGVGYAISRSALWSKCRNRKYVGIVGLLGGVLTLYASWAVFIYAVSARYSEEPLKFGPVDVFVHPAGLWGIIKLLNKHGWYEVFGGTPTGLRLWAFWAIEAGIILLVIPLMSITGITDRVFCEQGGTWCQRLESRFRLGIPDDPDLLQRVADGDLAALAELPPRGYAEAPALRVDLHRTDDPFGTRALQIKLAKLETDSKGNASENVSDLSPIYLLSPEQYEWVEQLADREPEEERAPEEEAAPSPTGDDADSAPPA